MPRDEGTHPPPSPPSPQRLLTAMDAAGIIVGVVIGAGIFRTPSLVAANTGSEGAFLLVWLLGGLISLVGALCYAELATAYPHAGGDYHYLTRAFGRGVAFLFAWARIAVIQTGSIALQAFIIGDYVSEVLSLGEKSSAVYAGLVIAAMTAVSLAGLRPGKWTQNVLTSALVLGLLSVAVAGLLFAPSLPPAAAPNPSGGGGSDPSGGGGSDPSGGGGALGLAMVFVLLTYGGWNEAAYLSAEVRDLRRNMVRALFWGIGIVTLVYVSANLAYLRGLGIAGVAGSQAVAADLVRRTFGEGGVRAVSVLITLAALSTINATIITGGRTAYALGGDFKLFGFLGSWKEQANTPTGALLAQGGVALVLVLLGSLTRDGFSAMVDYTAPVFWFFFLLTGLSLFVLRRKEPGADRPFRVPLYPVTPLLFCATCLYMLWSSLAYTKAGALVGVAVLVAGAPLWLLARLRQPEPVQQQIG